MKPIKLDNDAIEQLKDKFNEFLQTTRLTDNLINFSTTISKKIEDITQRPKIYMDVCVYHKMLQYVLLCDKEIAWHGTVERIDQNFHITDVFLYPQEITSITVRTDRKGIKDAPLYNDWAEKLTDDVYNKLRFQGHSHVNMHVSASGTDENNQKEFLQNLLDDDFYIFVIMNKSQKVNWCIYDLKTNILYDNDDINFYIYNNDKLVLTQIHDEIAQHITETIIPVSKSKYSSNYWKNYYKTPPEQEEEEDRLLHYIPKNSLSDWKIKDPTHSFEIAHPEIPGAYNVSGDVFYLKNTPSKKLRKELTDEGYEIFD